MSTNFNRMPGRIYDFIFSLIYAYDADCINDCYQLNLNPNRDVQEALEKTRKRIDMNFKGSDLFFNKENPCAEAFIIIDAIWQSSSIEEYISYLESYDETEVVRRVIRCLNDYKDMDNGVLESMDTVTSFINELKISKSLKWDVYQFIKNPSTYMKEFLNFLREYIKIFTEIEKTYKKVIDSFDQHIKRNFEEKGNRFLVEITQRDLEIDNSNLHVTTTFFNSPSLILSNSEDRLYALMGMDCEETFRKLQGEGEIENNINIFKTLSDSTRFEILRMVSQKEMYGQEIAEKFGITMASVTYHMNFLIGTNTVRSRPEGRKIYYLLNRDTIRNTVEFLNNIFNL